MDHRLAVTVIACVAALSAASLASAELVEREYHERFPATADTRIELDHGDGDVEVHPSEGDEILIDVEYRADVKGLGVGDARRFEVRFEQHGDVIRVSEVNDFSIVFGIKIVNRTIYRYTITAPPTVALALEGDDGDVTIESWRADVTCTTDDGTITLTDVTAAQTHVTTGDGDVSIDGLVGELKVVSDDGAIRLAHVECERAELSSHDGNIRVEESAGAFDVSTDDGLVRFDAVRASECRVRTGDGDIDLQLEPRETIDWDLTTDDGDIRLRIAGTIDARFMVQSEDGDIDLSLTGADELEETSHAVSGRIGEGWGRIRALSENGQIEIAERRP